MSFLYPDCLPPAEVFLSCPNHYPTPVSTGKFSGRPSQALVVASVVDLEEYLKQVVPLGLRVHCNPQGYSAARGFGWRVMAGYSKWIRTSRAQTWAPGDWITSLLEPQFLHLTFFVLKTLRCFKSCTALSQGGEGVDCLSSLAQRSVHKAGEGGVGPSSRVNGGPFLESLQPD